MFFFYLSAAVTLGLFVTAGFLLGNKTSDPKDYSLGGRQSSTIGVSGILLGALVGGASTVGTVQMAYSYGMTALWFTLGGGIGCLLLGLRFAAPLRDSNVTTVADFLAGSYGGKDSLCGKSIAFTATLSSSLGTFISIAAQFLSCIAMLKGLFPLSSSAASLIAGFSIIGFIAAGGLKSFSTLGGAKIVLLYFVLIACFVMAVLNGGTLSLVASRLDPSPWLNPFGRGFVPEIGYLASMIVGIFTTQIYIQALAAAKDSETAKKGAFASAILMPPMGLLGTWIGLTVRARGIEIRPDAVLSWFIMDSFPPFLGGVIWGAILITVIGCASGLILGVSTNIVKNLVPRKFMDRIGDKEVLIHRLIIGALVVTAAAAGVTGAGSMILEWSYLSMGLRGAGTFLPFIVAVLRPNSLSPKWALASSAAGLSGTLIWAFASLPGDPLFAGLGVSALCVLAGIRVRKNYI